MRHNPAAFLAVLLCAASAHSDTLPARVAGWPAGSAPSAPLNFRVTAYARGLDHPCSLLVLPNGDLLVAEARGARAQSAARPSANRITLLRDSSGSGAADRQYPLIEGLPRPFGLALRRDRLYVGASDAVYACPFLVGQTRLHGTCHAVLALPDDDGHGQWTRNLALSPDETTLYVAVGSRADGDVRRASEPERAAILAAPLPAKALRVYASGLRDPVGLAFEPASGRLWTTVSKRDEPDGEIAPDVLTNVRDGADYARPPGDARAVRAAAGADRGVRAVAPDVALGAHVAPTGLAFYGRAQFPKEYRGGAFVALNGSSDPRDLAGYKIVFVPFAAGRPAGPAEDFLTGFVKDAAAGEVYGRPAGVAVATDGSLFVADDAGDTVWRVTFKCAACTPDPPAAAGRR